MEQLSGSQVLLLTEDLEIEAVEDTKESEEEKVDIENIIFEEDSDELEEVLEVIDTTVTQDIDGQDLVEQTDIEEEITIKVSKEDALDWVETLVEEDGIININEEVEDLEDILENKEANEGEENIAVVLLGEEDTRDTKEEVAKESLAGEEEDKPIEEIKDHEKDKDIEGAEDNKAAEILCTEVEEGLKAPAPKRSFLGKFRSLFSKKQ